MTQRERREHQTLAFWFFRFHFLFVFGGSSNSVVFSVTLGCSSKRRSSRALVVDAAGFKIPGSVGRRPLDDFRKYSPQANGSAPRISTTPTTHKAKAPRVFPDLSKT